MSAGLGVANPSCKAGEDEEVVGQLTRVRGGKGKKWPTAARTVCRRRLCLVTCWRRAQCCPPCRASGFVLREFTVNLLNG